MPTPESVAAAASRRRLVLAYLETYITRHGFSPAITEIARHTDVTAATTASDLRRLRDQGLVTWTPHQPRTIRPTK